MRDIGSFEKELEKSGKADKLKAAMSSPEGQRLSQSLDNEALEKAAKTGDVKALQGMISDVLKTSDGQALYKQIQEMMKGK